MAKITVSRDLVLSIANKDNRKFVNNVNEKVNDLLASSIEDLSSQVSYISLDNTVLQPANELFNDSMVDNSYFIYLLGVESVQLDLNTAKKSRFWDSLKTRLKIAWQNRKMFKKKKKRRKKKNQEETVLDVKFDPSKYTVYDLAEDLQKTMCNYLLPTTIVYQGNNKFEIIGKEDFGPNVKIIIYLVSLVNGSFKYYNGKRKNAFINLFVSERYKKLKAKKKTAGKNFIKILKVLNALYFNINGHMPNQIFMESILAYCPDELFKGEDFYNVFLKIINYISIKSLRHIPSIIDEKISIMEDKLCGDYAIGFNKILQAIKAEEDDREESNKEHQE